MRCFTRLPSVCIVLRDLYPFGGLSEIGATTPILGSALPLVSVEGFEPSTPRLKVSCATTAPHAHRGGSFYRTLTAYCYDRINSLRRVGNVPPLDGAGSRTRTGTPYGNRF